MRISRVLIPAVIILLLLAMAPGAVAGAYVTVKGRPVGARWLNPTVTLPNGKVSAMTFTLRKSDGTRVKGYSVGSTRYYSSFNFSPYVPITRNTAYHSFRSAFTVGAKFVYHRQRAGSRTYKVLSRVYCKGIGE